MEANRHLVGLGNPSVSVFDEANWPAEWHVNHKSLIRPRLVQQSVSIYRL